MEKRKIAGKKRYTATDYYVTITLFFGSSEPIQYIYTKFSINKLNFRSISKRVPYWIWNQDHETAFVRKKEEIRIVAELSHFEGNQEIRSIFEASKQGLGAVLQQSPSNGQWKTNLFLVETFN